MTHQDAAVLREGGDRLCKQSEAQPTSNCILSTVSLNSSELELYLVIISVRLSCTTSEICVEKRGGRARGGQNPARFLKRRHLWIFAPTLFLKIYPAMAAANSTRMIRPRRMANCGEKNLTINNYYGDKRWAKKIKNLITINLKTEVEQKVSRAFGTNRTISIENTAPCCPLNTPALILCRTIKID